MAKSENQKLKLLYIRKYLLEHTDKDHRVTTADIIRELEKYEIKAERKSIYNDIECLREFGMDIRRVQKDRTYSYYVTNRPFELPELKLLVDSVQSARFITKKKTNDLIKKIEKLAGSFEASQLQRLVFVAGRVKTMNDSIYRNVDRLHIAISENSQIRFHYFQWNVRKEPELRRNGTYYTVSPWALSCSDGNYYLVAYDAEEAKIKHFRVDKMLDIQMTGEKRQGRSVFNKFDTAIYDKKLFGMFGGTEERVKLLCDNALAGVILDRFGTDVNLIPKGENQFTVNVDVAVSRQFVFWVLGLGDRAKIVAPESVVALVREEVTRLEQQYM